FSAKHDQGYWDVWENRRTYLEWLGKELAIDTQEKWYSVCIEDVIRHCGGGLLRRFDSIPDLLQDGFPEMQWLPWRFSVVPHKYWDRIENQRKAFDWVAQQKGFHTLRKI